MWDGPSHEELMPFDEQEALAARDAEESEANELAWENEQQREAEKKLKFSTRFYDFDGAEVKVGTAVKAEWFDADKVHHLDYGTVIALGDPDGDVDDEGRAIEITPTITVKWNNEEDPEELSTFNDATGYMEDAKYVCEDVEVVQKEKNDPEA